MSKNSEKVKTIRTEEDRDNELENWQYWFDNNGQRILRPGDKVIFEFDPLLGIFEVLESPKLDVDYVLLQKGKEIFPTKRVYLRLI